MQNFTFQTCSLSQNTDPPNWGQHESGQNLWPSIGTRCMGESMDLLGWTDHRWHFGWRHLQTILCRTQRWWRRFILWFLKLNFATSTLACLFVSYHLTEQKKNQQKNSVFFVLFSLFLVSLVNKLLVFNWSTDWFLLWFKFQFMLVLFYFLFFRILFWNPKFFWFWIFTVPFEITQKHIWMKKKTKKNSHIHEEKIYKHLSSFISKFK